MFWDVKTSTVETSLLRPFLSTVCFELMFLATEVFPVNSRVCLWNFGNSILTSAVVIQGFEIIVITLKNICFLRCHLFN